MAPSNTLLDKNNAANESKIQRKMLSLTDLFGVIIKAVKRAAKIERIAPVLPAEKTPAAVINIAPQTWILEPGIKDDFHDVWIDNKDPNRMIATNDGGCQVSMTGGKTWSGQYTQKISQLYRVNVDNDFPYNVYGSVQDLLAYKMPSASRWGGISGYETT